MPTRRTPRTDHLTTAWLILSLVAVAVVTLAPGAFPASWWTTIHLITLGVLTNAVMQWSWFFAKSLLRLPADHPSPGRHAVIRTLVFNAALVGLIAGMWSATAWLVVAMAGVVGAVISWHGLAMLLALRHAFASRFAVVIRYYATASAFLVLGCIAAGVLAVALFGADAPAWVVDHRTEWTLAHALLNICGWLGLAIAGTLVTFGPTVLRTRMSPDAVNRAMQALPYLAGGILGAAVAAIASWMPGIALGLAVALAAVTWGTVRPLVTVALAKPPREHASRTLATGLGWLLLALGSVAASAAFAPDAATLRASLAPWLPVLGAGIGQVFIGALTFLFPVVIGGGPHAARAAGRILDRLSPFRLGVRNSALALAAVTLLTAQAPLTLWWLLIVATFVADVALLVIAATHQIRLKKAAGGEPVLLVRNAEEAKAAATEMETPASPHGALASAVAGALAVVLVSLPLALPATLTGGDAVPPTVEPTGHTTQVTVTVDGMAFTPSRIEVPLGDSLEITFTNTGDQRHDLVLASGEAAAAIAPGATEVLTVPLVSASMLGWCSLPGHRAMGMELEIVVTEQPDAGHGAGHDHGTAGAAGSPTMAQLRSFADTMPAATAALAPASASAVHEYTFTVTETLDPVTTELTRAVWTYNGTSPGPTLRGALGDTFRITLVNDGTMGHSIDFHAGELAPDEPMRTIEPGESLVYEFTANRSGIWMYHCGTMPMSHHVANGMFGAVIIDPPGLPAVDREYVLIQSEMYLGADGESADGAALAAVQPDVVTFNGRAFQYAAHPLTARTGERVRFWVLDAGPNIPLAFHVVGMQFDTVWAEGAYSVFRGGSTDGVTAGATGSQTLALLASQGGFVEAVVPEAGTYSFVNHQMTYAERGASGLLVATD